MSPSMNMQMEPSPLMWDARNKTYQPVLADENGAIITDENDEAIGTD